MDQIKLAVVFGTRPEAIKMAPVVLEMQKYPEFIRPVVIVTAQHREMLDQVLRLFAIKPDYDLNIMSQRQTLYDVSRRALSGLEEVFSAVRPDMVLVHGDTTTTFIGALAAYYRQITVGHVEAGLRTGNKYFPFPEEANRRLTGVLTDFHFAPTQNARDNLLRENVDPANIYVTGNTVIDALQETVRGDYIFTDPELAGCLRRNCRLILVTTHRRENWGEPLRNIYRALRKVLEMRPDVEVIFPVHKNPVVRDIAAAELAGRERVHLIDPMDYQPFANLMARACLILSDSGGVQEEAPALGKPVLVLRGATERPEALAAGTVRLVGADYNNVLANTLELLDDKAAYAKMAGASNPYGDGRAAGRIIKTILHKKGFPVGAPEYFA